MLTKTKPSKSKKLESLKKKALKQLKGLHSLIPFEDHKLEQMFKDLETNIKKAKIKE